MNTNRTPEVLLTQILNSSTIRKIAVAIVLLGILICFIPSLPPVQNIIFSFVDENISGKGSGGDFDIRLKSLLSLPFLGLLVCVFLFCCLFSKKIAMFLENEKNNSLITAVAIGLNMLLIGFVSVFSYRYGWQWLDSDHSSEMILGKFLAQENVFVSSKWHYSTEIRLIYQTLFSMPLFKLLGNAGDWALIRALVILFNSIVLILSYFFMMKQMKVHAKWVAITSLFLIAPISIEYWNIIIFGGFYALFLVQFFCTIGLFIKLIGCSDSVKKPVIAFVFFTLLSFLLGLQGIRSLLSLFIPLCITCVYLRFKTQREKIFTVFLGGYGFFICCVGVAANYLLLFKFKFHSFDSMHFTDLWVDFFPKLGQCIVSLAGFFGLSGGYFSAHGFYGLSAGSTILSAAVSVIAIIGTVILFWAVFRLRNKAQTSEHKYLSIFFIVSVLFNIFIFVIADESIKLRYFSPFMILYVPFTAILFNDIKALNYLKCTAVVAGIILFVFGQSYIQFRCIAGHKVWRQLAFNFIG